MTTDLAARVRQLVEGGVGPITLDEVALRAPEKSTSARRTAVVAATLVLVVVLSVAVVAALDRDASRNAPAKMLSSALPLSEIPEGVSVQQFGYRLAFVVRDGSEYTVFDTNVHHLPGEKALWWCPKEQLFIAPTHAETFSKSGKAIGGPATAALDRYQAAVRRNQLRVDLSQVVPGAKGNAQTPTGQKGGTGVGAWDSGPDSFCEGALKVNNALPTSVLRVEALASGTYREKVYTVP